MEASKALAERNKMPGPVIPVNTFWDVTGFYEESGNWFVEGYCTTFARDVEGDFVTKGAAEGAVDTLVGMSLLYNHDPDRPVGVITAAKVDDVGIWIKAMVSQTEPKVWTQINERVLNKFSIRFFAIDEQVHEEPDGTVTIYINSMDMREVSITTLPANLGSIMAHSYVGKSARRMSIMPGEAVELILKEVRSVVEDFKAGRLKTSADTGPEGGGEEDPNKKKTAADGSPPAPETPPTTEKSTETPPETPAAGDDRIKSLEDENAKLKSTVDTMSARMEDLVKSFEQLKESVPQLVEAVVTKAAESIFGRVEATNAEVAKSVTEMKDQVKTFSEKIKAVDGLEPLSQQLVEAGERLKSRENDPWGGAFPW